MIGDWVYMEHTEDGVAPYEELTQWTKEDFGFSDTFIETHIYPVPLSPEIMEKNGFIENRGITSWKFETKREDLIDIYGVDDYHLSINIEDTHGTGKGYRWLLRELVIRYVHELQHALRLCGIKKEIEL